MRNVFRLVHLFAVSVTKVVLKRIILQNFRNYAYAQFSFKNPIILIQGSNGVGKTNLLESISLLGMGRGMKSSKIEDMGLLENSQHKEWTNFYELSEHTVSIQNHNNKKSVRLNHKLCQKKSLSDVLRVFWISPENDRLFVKSPENRRNFVNQLIFGVNPSYKELWGKYEHLVQERNHVLKQKKIINDSWLSLIEKKIADCSVEIYALRSEFIISVNAWISTLKHFSMHRFVIQDVFEKDNRDTLYEQMCHALKTNRQYDQIYGGSRIGPHKSLFIGFRNDVPLALCSNSQQCIALISIFLALIKNQSTNIIFLIDEIFSHLDETYQALFIDEIQKYQHLQTYITTLLPIFLNQAQIIELEERMF